jgi:hemoglobin
MSSLFERLGGRITLEKVHKILYDSIYADNWMKNYFQYVEQKHIEEQQTDFMTKFMGGGEVFSGRMPAFAHEHVYIDLELYEYRHNLLIQALKEANIPEDLRKEWLNLDLSFKKAIIKKDVSQCKKRYATDHDVLVFENPANQTKKVG